jgi:tRNA-dihydrouridine synthase A
MKGATGLPVTVKCRIGVDDQDPEAALDAVAGMVFSAGADALWVHARKAWLQGLSPKENREIPPLDYDRVYRLKARWPDRFVGINGGIRTLAEAQTHLASVDGVMLGRAAYHNPRMLAGIDAGQDEEAEVDFAAIIDAMKDYAARHIAQGGRLAHVTRHMTGLLHGMPGARLFRQVLSTEATRPGAGPDVLDRALDAASRAAEMEAA